MRNFATNKARGQIAVFAVLLTLVIVGFVSVLAGTLLSNARILRQATENSLGLQLAESGIDKALWCLNHPLAGGCASYSGETANQGAGSFTVAASTGGNTSTITGTGTVNGKTRTIKLTAANTSSADASFYYGVQAGAGGILMNNNSKIQGAGGAPGNVYVNGSVRIAGGSGSGTEITGDAILALGTSAVDAQADPPSPYTMFDVRGSSSTRYVAQSFVPTVDDLVTRIDLKIARTSSAPNNPTLALYYDNGSDKPGTQIPGALITITSGSLPVNTAPGWQNGFTNFTFTPQTQVTAGVKYWIVLQVSGADTAKYFTVVQSTSAAAYTNGTAKTGNNLTSGLDELCTSPSACDMAFRVNIGGVKPTLQVEKVGGEAHAYYMDKATIVKKAYYRQITSENNVYTNNGADECENNENGPNCLDIDVSGGSDPTPEGFPLSDAQVAIWEAAAEDGGVIDCAATPALCTISAGVIGPKKYLGDVTISGNSTVAMNGTVWVQGNLTLGTGAKLKLSDDYGANSSVIIADNQTNDSTKVNSGRIIANSDSAFLRNATTGTYIMGVAMSASLDPAVPAFSIGNNFSKVGVDPLAAAIVYVPKGVAKVSQNAELKEVTAQLLYLENNAVVIYETGLSSIIFSSGPGGAWQPTPQTWQDLH